MSMLAAKAMGADSVIMTGEIFLSVLFISLYYIIITQISVNLDLISQSKVELLMFFLLKMTHKQQQNV